MQRSVRAQEKTPPPTPSANEEVETTKTVDFSSPDGNFAFLIGRGEYQQTIDLIDKNTEKVLQHIADDDMSSVYYRVLWAPDPKRFALITRMGHPNQGVTVYFQNGETFREIELPELNADIPEKLKRGTRFPHISTNNWQEAKE